MTTLPPECESCVRRIAMDQQGVLRLARAVIEQAIRDLLGADHRLRMDALRAIRSGGLDAFAEAVGIPAERLRSELERRHEIHLRRLHHQVEAEIRLYPERRRAVDRIIREHAEKLPIPYSEERIHTAGKVIANPTFRALLDLHKDKRYRRLIRVVRAVERLYVQLDPQQRRVVECYYWDGLSLEDTARELGVSVDTIRRRRREICEAALWLFQSAGLSTFEVEVLT